MAFLHCWFGYAEGGVSATEWYSGGPVWWGFPVLTEKISLEKMPAGHRGFAVPWAMFVDEDHRFWLNCNYTVYGGADERAVMEVARAPEGYYVGLSRCPQRTWSPHGGYSDPFVPLPVLNLRSREPVLDPTEDAPF